jgi:hypothetical protein
MMCSIDDLVRGIVNDTMERTMTGADTPVMRKRYARPEALSGRAGVEA